MLINAKVKHNIWGEGIIKSIQGHRLTVEFDKVNGATKSVIFAYPEAFRVGYLTLS